MRFILLAVALTLLAGCAADAAEESESEYTVGAFERVEGANHLRADLGRPGRYDSGITSRSGGEWSPSVNVLFYDLGAREGRWLFSTSEQVILQEEAVRDSARVRAFVFVIVEEDTNADGRLDGEDARSIVVSDPTGQRRTRVAEGVRSYRQAVRLDDDRVLLLFDAGGSVRGVEVGVDDVAVQTRITMPAPPSDS